MAAPTIQNVSYNPLDPQGSATLGQAMLKAQLQQQMAQQMMEHGSQQPDPNAYIPGNSEAPARVIKENPLGGLARALQQGVGAYTQKEAMQKQLSLQQAMMQRQFGMMNGVMGGEGGAAGQGGSSSGGDGLKKAMLLSMMGASPEVVTAAAKYGEPTTEMKNSGAHLAPATGTNMTFGDSSGGPSGQYPPGYVFPSKEAAQNAPLSAGGFTSPNAQYNSPAPDSFGMQNGSPPPLPNAALPTSNGMPSALPVSTVKPVADDIPGMPGLMGSTAPQITPPQNPPAQSSDPSTHVPILPPASVGMQGGKLITDGLPQGNVLAKDANGNLVQKQVEDVDAKAKLDYQLQKISNMYDDLKKHGGAVQTDNPLTSATNNNLVNTLAASNIKLPEWAGGAEFGGQDLARMAGTRAQEDRDNINAEVSRTLPLYMQAMHLTPGMERSFGAQEQMNKAIGGDVSKSYETNKQQLANLSHQIGAGGVNYQRADAEHPDVTALKSGISPEDIAAYKRMKGIQ